MREDAEARSDSESMPSLKGLNQDMVPDDEPADNVEEENTPESEIKMARVEELIYCDTYIEEQTQNTVKGASHVSRFLPKAIR